MSDDGDDASDGLDAETEEDIDIREVAA